MGGLYFGNDASYYQQAAEAALVAGMDFDSTIRQLMYLRQELIKDCQLNVDHLRVIESQTTKDKEKRAARRAQKIALQTTYDNVKEQINKSLDGLRIMRDAKKASK